LVSHHNLSLLLSNLLRALLDPLVLVAPSAHLQGQAPLLSEVEAHLPEEEDSLLLPPNHLLSGQGPRGILQ
jgi:hypothetical protein